MNKSTILAAILAAAVGTTSTAQAQTEDTPMLNQGNKELALSGIIEFPEFEEVDFDIDVSYGYFVRDGWEVGARLLGADVGGVERFDLSLFTEYNFRRHTNVVPYIGTSVGVASVSYDEGEFDSGTTLSRGDDEATVFGVQAGVKWFVRPYMAISTSIAFNVSSDDIYQADNELADNLTRFRLGLRYYF